MPRQEIEVFALFPAHAGVILGASRKWGLIIPVPRTRGGDPLPNLKKMHHLNCSPHTRG